MAIARPFDNAQAVAPSLAATGAFTSIVMPCLNEAETVTICVS